MWRSFIFTLEGSTNLELIGLKVENRKRTFSAWAQVFQQFVKFPSDQIKHWNENQLQTKLWQILHTPNFGICNILKSTKRLHEITQLSDISAYDICLEF